MEEVDKLIRKVLLDLNCPIEEDEGEDESVWTLRSLTVELVFEGLVRCLRRIAPAAELPSSVRLPPQMTSRYRVATLVADAIKSTGYRGDIGYQTLLYGSEGDTRRLFIHLIDLLPKDDSAQAEASEQTAMERLCADGAQRIRQDVEAPWVPWFCRRHRLKWDGRLWYPTDQTESVIFRTYDSMWNADGSTVPHRFIAPTLLEASGSLAAGFSQTTSASYNESLMSKIECMLATRTSSIHVPGRPETKPKPPPKPVSLKREITEQQDKEKEQRLKEEKETALLNDMLVGLDETASSTYRNVANLRSQIKEVVKQRTSLEEIQKRKRNEFDTTERRYLALLQDPQRSSEKLKAFLEQAEERIHRLEAQWADHRIPKQKELADAKEKALSMGGVGRMSLEVQDMRRRRVELSEELAAKRDFVQHLRSEHAKMTKSISRSAYTKRILEIVANVRKQRQEIDKVIEENRVIQKRINLLQGNLERSFVAVEETLYKAAVGDQALQKAYQILVSTHGHCSELISTLEQTGHMQREIEEIQDQIETESQKSTDSNLERLVNDFCDVRRENEHVEEQINSLSNG